MKIFTLVFYNFTSNIVRRTFVKSEYIIINDKKEERDPALT